MRFTSIGTGTFKNIPQKCCLKKLTSSKGDCHREHSVKFNKCKKKISSTQRSNRKKNWIQANLQVINRILSHYKFTCVIAFDIENIWHLTKLMDAISNGITNEQLFHLHAIHFNSRTYTTTKAKKKSIQYDFLLLFRRNT